MLPCRMCYLNKYQCSGEKNDKVYDEYLFKFQLIYTHARWKFKINDLSDTEKIEFLQIKAHVLVVHKENQIYIIKKLQLKTKFIEKV